MYESKHLLVYMYIELMLNIILIFEAELSERYKQYVCMYGGILDNEIDSCCPAMFITCC